MKNWPEWLKYWQDLWEEMGDVPAPDFSPVPEPKLLKLGIQKVTDENRLEVVRACCIFARTEEWPDMSTDVQWLVQMRILNAAELALVLCMPVNDEVAVEPTSSMTEAKLREWFLVWSWERVANRWADRVALGTADKVSKWAPPEAN